MRPYTSKQELFAVMVIFGEQSMIGRNSKSTGDRTEPYEACSWSSSEYMNLRGSCRHTSWGMNLARRDTLTERKISLNKKKSSCVFVNVDLKLDSYHGRFFFFFFLFFGQLTKAIVFTAKSKTFQWNIVLKQLILKTIGNRKGDCAWSCSRGQTQPEKICKSQRTNQCHSLRTFYWFVLCNLQIFSGCVCPLEQLHAQSPFLFPIVFSINLIPFFDISSVLAIPSPRLFGYVLLYFTWATARSQELLFVVLACHALRALDSRCRLRTRRRVCICIGSTRCRGNHMHDHSRFQRDIDDVTGVSLSLSTTHKSHSRTI